MRDFNCDSLKNLEAPEELIERALRVPAVAAAPRPRAGLFRGLMAAAAIALVAAGSITAYLLIRRVDESSLPVAPTEQSSEGDSCVSTEPDASSIPGEEASTGSAGRRADDPTVAPHTEPAAPKPEGPSDAFADHPDNDNAIPAMAPDDALAAPETASPTAPSPPTPSEEPSERPEPTETPSTGRPGTELASVGYMVPISSYTGSEEIYCRLYGSDGSLVGDENLYEESHRVYFTTGSGYLFLSYPLGAIVEPLPPDHYTIIFYDGDENDFYICSAFLSKK